MDFEKIEDLVLEYNEDKTKVRNPLTGRMVVVHGDIGKKVIKTHSARYEEFIEYNMKKYGESREEIEGRIKKKMTKVKTDFDVSKDELKKIEKDLPMMIKIKDEEDTKKLTEERTKIAKKVPTELIKYISTFLPKDDVAKKYLITLGLADEEKDDEDDEDEDEEDYIDLKKSKYDTVRERVENKLERFYDLVMSDKKNLVKKKDNEALKKERERKFEVALKLFKKEDLLGKLPRKDEKGKKISMQKRFEDFYESLENKTPLKIDYSRISKKKLQDRFEKPELIRLEEEVKEFNEEIKK